MNDGLLCQCTMPLSWREAAPDASERRAMLGEAALVLAAINQMEGGHEIESAPENRRLERLEAKLDLTLHLLAKVLEPAPPPPGIAVGLGGETVEWRDERPPAAGTAIVLELRPSEALPLAIRLPAVALAPNGGLARARFQELNEELADALTQFVFRRHRQAIRAKAV